MSSSSNTDSSSTERFTGRVKWFNNKAGYGFVTVTDGLKSGTDVFVHHSSIKVDSEQYKYLVQGEYIEFSLSDTKTSDHEYQAGDVSGIKGGKLMCETRRDSRSARTQYRGSPSTPEPQETYEPVKMPRSVAPPRQGSSAPSRQNAAPKSASARGQGPREGGDWNYVGKSKNVADPSIPQKREPNSKQTKSAPKQSAPKQSAPKQSMEL
jgi:CspA family cold shock protein